MGRFSRATAIAVVAVMLASGGTAVAATVGTTGWTLPPGQKDPSIPVKPVPAKQVPDIDVKTQPLPKPIWPPASDSDVDVPPAGADAKQRAGVQPSGTPVRVAPSKDTQARTASKVHVHVTDHNAANALGLHGVLLTVTGSGADPVHVGLDYSTFAGAFGAGWADRLRMFELPACALTTPAKAECRVRTPIENSVNDGGRREVGADIVFPAQAQGITASAQQTRVLAAAAGSSGSSGTPTAPPIAAAGSWSSGGSSGDFSYGYPFSVTKSPSGDGPNLGLAYSSSSVDGLTSGTNNQTSWVGDGWNFTPGGFVERHYKPCSEDLDGNNGKTKTGDQCWGIDNATLSLGGKSTELIKVDDKLWRPKQDDGSKVELLTGAENGASHGQHWKVTTGDGTQYFFGLNRPPGWTDGKPETESTWTVPVFGNNDGEDCYKANNFAGSWCQQAWRWNLDYMVDSHGNASAYYYQPELNYYGLNRNVTTAGTVYTAGGYPLRVEYGLRLANDSVYGSGPTNQVTFDTAERCIPTDTFACEPDKLTADTANAWPDVPFDQICAEGKPCDYGAPAFFTRKRLVAMHSQYFAAGKPVDVDQWDFKQDYPGSGDAMPPALWLTSITHTGKNGDKSITMPPTTFDRYVFPNRVDTVGDKYTPLTRSRMKEIRTETGGRVTIAYSAPDCVANERIPDSPETDTMRCYASYWSPPAAKDPVLDWFHKYVVTDVTEEDLTGGSEPVVTHYDYVGDAAWHYDEGQFTPDDRKTWGQWRGYNLVRTSIGAPNTVRTVNESLYLRGMDGDHLPNGTRPASVKDSDGGSIVDEDPLQGFVRESRTYLPDGKTVDSSSINDPWLRGPTATSSDDLLKAYMINVGSVHGRTLLSDGKTYRRTQVNRKFNDDGMAIEQEDRGDTSTGADDTCTKTTYVANDNGMFDRSDESYMFAGTCDHEANAQNSITDVQVSYDHNEFGAPPEAGDITETRTLDSWDSAGKHFVTTSKNEYDAYGREVLSTDVFDKTIKTEFIPSSGGPVTGTKTTNTFNWVSTTTLEPSRGNPTSSVDVNNVRTDVEYDALGRKTAVWNPGRNKAGGDSATATFEYTLSLKTPTTVRTKSLQDNGAYTDSYTIYDGLGRSRQVQVPAHGGGRVLTDTLYDSRGLPFKTNGAFFNADSGPNGTLVAAADNTVPNQTVTEYDSRGRTTASILKSKAVEQWRTSTIYEGDRTTTIPPAGASPSTVVTDVQGQPVQRLQYKNGFTPGGANPADVSSYTYNAAGAMTGMTDSAGNVWTDTYDLRGRKISQTDPDAGTSTFSYDKAGQLTSTTDARGKKLIVQYDALGRKVKQTEGSESGPTLATWTYDTLPRGLGLLTSSTRWDGQNAYTKRVVNYDSYSRPTKTAVDIPAKEGPLQGTYEFTTRYSSTGAIVDQGSPKAGNLPAEHIMHTYTDLGLPSTSYAIDSNGVITNLVSQSDYTSYNEMSRLQLDGATSSANIGLTQTYDEVTRRAQTTTVIKATQVGSELTKRTYTYDPAGTVRKIADTPSGGKTDVQCFDYDYLQRMTEAWTPSSGDCATAKSAKTLGGAAPYWNSYEFDPIGNRTKQVEHKPAGDVTSKYTYPASGASSVRPHALQKVDTSGPNGTSTSSYTYDEVGSTRTRNVGGDTQTFSYTSEGQTAGETDKTGASTYVYDADGSRLISHDPTGATLSIGDLELFQTAGTTGVTATRFYTHGGGLVAERVGSTGLKWMLSDHHGTNGMSITAGTLQVTQRFTDPFGNSRDAVPPGWPDKHGFVGGYQDTTGLTHLGARDYDPSTGRFTKADPLLNAEVPQEWNAYAYAGNSPVSLTDPSGMSTCHHMGEDGLYCPPGASPSCTYQCHPNPGDAAGTAAGKAAQDKYIKDHNVNTAAYRDAQALVKKTKWDVFIDAAGDLIKGLIGWDDIKDCLSHGAVGACIRTVVNLIPWGKVLKTGEIIADFWKGAKALVTFGKEVAKAEKVIVDTERVLVDAQKAGMAAERMAVDAERAAAQAAKAAEEAKAASAAERGGGGATSCALHSFVAGTLVAMADGTAKPIEQVKIGDFVLSTNPETGGVERHEVVGTLIHADEDERTEITVEADGGFGKVTATDWHPVWAEEVGKWVAIGDLAPGQHLHSPDGQPSVVTAVRHFQQNAPVFDLTVDGVHTYNVLAGLTPVLVHNCGDRIYEAGGKHNNEVRSTSRGPNSREPADGQGALENSVQIKSTAPRRVGIDPTNGDVVVLDRTHPAAPCGCKTPGGTNEVFHGHVRSDFAKSPAMQGARNALRRALKSGAITPYE
ncbi:intein C-terminal splicing region/RHS repeat-associated core domain-containing protein [Amycolatopsis xylanica]|uniref:Intein C-terminal splicing region/RHS repeat-associated core domain-containing protein n=1 Tax=Amycolatopsis xylanica TaxID=589385 RepID=A0A1H3R2S0_9PSEU|nr:RHS repeat-associated core domain-containing protein [Amycolatopsis xylanica]SDZ19920.1 intein C-terminal splicing region/RHS repeat-associated core domain-containing protein [Amycolatopsis xylanica]